MGRVGIQYEDVARAINKLQKKKKTITGDNVRIELGTGSKNTICRHLRHWKSLNGKMNNYETARYNALRRNMIRLVKEMAELLGIKAGDIAKF